MNLIDMTVKGFASELASASPAPGGGSVAALAGSLGAALCAMVSRLTVGREKYKNAWADMEKVQVEADALNQKLLDLVDRDTEAYNQVMAAFKLPKETGGQKIARKEAIQAANKNAALVPLETLRTVSGLTGLVGQVIEKGNPNCITDAGVAAQLIRTAALGAAYNVRINLSGIDDEAFRTRLAADTSMLLQGVLEAVDTLASKVDKGIG